MKLMQNQTVGREGIFPPTLAPECCNTAYSGHTLASGYSLPQYLKVFLYILQTDCRFRVPGIITSCIPSYSYTTDLSQHAILSQKLPIQSPGALPCRTCEVGQNATKCSSEASHSKASLFTQHFWSLCYFMSLYLECFLRKVIMWAVSC